MSGYRRQSRWRTHQDPSRGQPAPVKISYLPGFEPPPEIVQPKRKRPRVVPDPPAHAVQKATYPFRAVINGRNCTVTVDGCIYDDDDSYDDDIVSRAMRKEP